MSINQDDNEYYLTLPSNVSGSNNTISSWTTTLPSTLQLQGQWECGLAEIIYTNSAYTIPDPLPFEIHFQNGKVDHYYVPEGNYDSPAKLVSTLSSVLNSKPPVKRRKRDTAGAKPKEDELLEEDVEGALKPVQVEQKPAENLPKEDELLEEDVEGELQPVKAEQKPTEKETKEDKLLEEDVEGELKPVQVEEVPAVTPSPPQSTPPTESTSTPPAAPPVPKPDNKDDKKPDKKVDKKPDKKDDKKPDKKNEKENNSSSSSNVTPKPTTSLDPVTETTVKPPTTTTLPPIKEDNEDELLEADDDQSLQVISVEYPPAHVPATVTVQGEKFQGSTMQIPSDTQVVYNSWGRNEPIPPKRKPHERTETTIPKLPKLAPPVMAENSFGVIKMTDVPQQTPVQQQQQLAGGGAILAEDENSPTKPEDTEMLEEDEDGSLDPVEEAGPPPVAFVYDEFSNRIRVEVNSARASSVHLSKGLMFLLGFEEPSIKSTRLSKYSPTTQAGSNALYIFSDIAAYSILGDTTSNQLRIVPVIGAYGTTCNAVFNPVRYFGCRTGMINSIQIDIRNEYGELIKFHYGTAVIVLHLRKKRH